MPNDWIFDAVQAEVAYRTSERYKAGPGTRPVRRRRWPLGRRRAEIRLPEPRRASPDDTTAPCHDAHS